jgi:glucokinase
MQPPTVSLTDAKLPLFLGVDVGGTNIKIGIVDDNGNTVCSDSVPTDAKASPDEAMTGIGDKFDQLLKQNKIDSDKVVGVGLGTPGTMDIKAGMLLRPHNLPGWWNYPIRDRLSETLGKPVTFVNDANAAAYGEYWIGKGKQYDSIVLLTLGTGVGGGIIVDGQLIHGATSHGGEIGHVSIESGLDARVCGCGRRGHLEAYASATALINSVKNGLADHPESSLAIAAGQGKRITGKLIADAAEQNDEFALTSIMELAYYLGKGISTVAHMVDPEAVILGGAMNFGGDNSPLGQRFLQKVRETVAPLTFLEIGSNLKITFASLGGAAGYIGAAGVARLAHLQKNQPTMVTSN